MSINVSKAKIRSINADMAELLTDQELLDAYLGGKLADFNAKKVAHRRIHHLLTDYARVQFGG